MTLHADDAPTVRAEKESGRQKRYRTSDLNAYRHRNQSRYHEEVRLPSLRRIRSEGMDTGGGRRLAGPCGFFPAITCSV